MLIFPGQLAQWTCKGLCFRISQNKGKHILNRGDFWAGYRIPIITFKCLM